jgi:hypothetical protein
VPVLADDAPALGGSVGAGVGDALDVVGGQDRGELDQGVHELAVDAHRALGIPGVVPLDAADLAEHVHGRLHAPLPRRRLDVDAAPDQVPDARGAGEHGHVGHHGAVVLLARGVGLLFVVCLMLVVVLLLEDVPIIRFDGRALGQGRVHLGGQRIRLTGPGGRQRDGGEHK